jgi:hypothetical protein
MALRVSNCTVAARTFRLPFQSPVRLRVAASLHHRMAYPGTLSALVLKEPHAEPRTNRAIREALAYEGGTPTGQSSVRRNHKDRSLSVRSKQGIVNTASSFRRSGGLQLSSASSSSLSRWSSSSSSTSSCASGNQLWMYAAAHQSRKRQLHRNGYWLDDHLIPFTTSQPWDVHLLPGTVAQVNPYRTTMRAIRRHGQDPALPPCEVAEAVMGAHETGKLIYERKWKSLGGLVLILESEENRHEGSPVEEAVTLLAASLRDAAQENPDPRAISRAQFVRAATHVIRGDVDARSLHQLYSNMDAMSMDRVPHASISGALMVLFKPELMELMDKLKRLFLKNLGATKQQPHEGQLQHRGSRSSAWNLLLSVFNLFSRDHYIPTADLIRVFTVCSCTDEQVERMKFLLRDQLPPRGTDQSLKSTSEGDFVQIFHCKCEVIDEFGRQVREARRIARVR